MNHLETALTQMRRSPYQSLAAVLTVSITCFVAYWLSLLLLGAHVLLGYFESRPQVIAFFELTAPTQQVQQVAETMRSKPYVASVTLVDKEKALSLYREDNRDDPLLLELVTSDILPASIELSGTTVEDLEKIKKDLDTQSGIDEVIFQQDLVDVLSRWVHSLRIVGSASIAIMGLNAFLVISMIVSMKLLTKKSAIHTMRIIGATRWYITWPFFYEGMVYGLLGSGFGWSLMFVSFLYASPWLKDFLGSLPLLPVPWSVFAIQVSVGTLFTMLLGGFVGTLAVRRFIKK